MIKVKKSVSVLLIFSLVLSLLFGATTSLTPFNVNAEEATAPTYNYAADTSTTQVYLDYTNNDTYGIYDSRGIAFLPASEKCQAGMQASYTYLLYNNQNGIIGTDIQPYIVYQVAQNSSFSFDTTIPDISAVRDFHDYTGISIWDCDIKVFLSTDRVTWTEVEPDTTITGENNEKTRTIENVGNANFVKLLYPQDATNYRTETLTYDQFSNKAVALNSVTFTKGEADEVVYNTSKLSATTAEAFGLYSNSKVEFSSKKIRAAYVDLYKQDTPTDKPYVVYAVKANSAFSMNVGFHKNANITGISAAINSGDKYKFGITLYTSADGVVWSECEHGIIYSYNSDNKLYQTLNITVPEDALFVKAEFPQDMHMGRKVYDATVYDTTLAGNDLVDIVEVMVTPLAETDIPCVDYVVDDTLKANISNADGFLTAEEMNSLFGTYDATPLLDGKAATYNPFWVSSRTTNGYGATGLFATYGYLSTFTSASAEVYLTYKVKPSTQFGFTYSIGKPSGYTGDFKFKVFESTDGINWDAEPAFTSVETGTSQTAAVQLKDTTNYVKLVFPQTGASSGIYNDNARVEAISYVKGDVGGFAVNGGLKGNVANTTGFLTLEEMNTVLGVYDSTALIYDKSSDINFNPFMVKFANTNGVKKFGLYGGYGYLITASAEMYLTYHVKPGSEFKFTYSIAKPAYDGEFKFKVFESADGITWETEPVFASVETGTSQSASIQLKGTTKYVKLVFPQTGTSMGAPHHDNARIEALYYVPSSDINGFNANGTLKGDIANANGFPTAEEMKNVLGVYDSTALLEGKSADYYPFQIYNANVNSNRKYGLIAGWGYLSTFTDSSTEVYLTYSVKKASQFKFTYTIAKPSYDGEFKFKVYESTDGINWETEPAFASVETGTSQLASVQLKDTTKYVKLVFPQTGTSMGDCWNHNARIEALHYVPNNTDDYVKHTYNTQTAITQGNKAELGIFNTSNVTVGADGVAVSDNTKVGYVDFRFVADTTNVQFVCDADISFEVSKDGLEWYSITAVPTNIGYNFTLFEGYEFIRATLGTNAAITSVTTDFSSEIYNEYLINNDINADGGVNVLDFIKMCKAIGSDEVYVYNPARYSTSENQVTEFNPQTLISIKKALLGIEEVSDFFS